jgi:hypothetical protein
MFVLQKVTQVIKNDIKKRLSLPIDGFNVSNCVIFYKIEVYVLALFILELKALKERKFASGMRMPVY